MKRAWKPGDVAALTIKSKADGRDETGGKVVGIRDNVGSWACGAATGRWVRDSDVRKARPLVVIDPEDSEAVNALSLALGSHDVGFEEVQAALRSLTAPPKPDEPTGHMAVVEDSDGLRWVNWRDPRGCNVHERPWVLTSDSHTYLDYADIDVVRVLSEGVTS